MVGTLHLVNTNKIYEQFRIDVIEGMKVHLHRYMNEKQLSINDLGGEHIQIAGFIKRHLDSKFEEYGVELQNFNIEEIIIDENDEGYKKVMDGISAGVSAKRRRDMLGDAYTQERQLDIMEQSAKNEGVAGGMMGAGLGFGIGNTMGNVMNNMQGGIQQSPSTPPPPVASIHITQSGQTYGPYTVQQIQEFVAQGTVKNDTLVWKQGIPSWVTADSLPELLSLFKQTGTPPPPPPIPNK